MDEQNRQLRPDRFLIQVQTPEVNLIDEIPISDSTKGFSLVKYNGNRPNYYQVTPKSVRFYSVRGPFEENKKPVDWKFISCDIRQISI